MRARNNRRKAPPRKINWPRIHINWRLVLLPPFAIAVAFAIFTGSKVVLDRPVQQLSVEAPFQRVTEVQIEAVIAPALGSGFLSVDLDGLSERLLQLDWVKDARVMRRWPDTLAVRISEHHAAARWGEHGLLNVNGELFTKEAKHAFPELPQLDGPLGSEQRVAQLYLQVRGQLAAAHLALDTLEMDDRGALSFTLLSGQEIRIGREDIEARVERFFAVAAPALTNDFDRISYVDLRYSNGFSVAWREQPSPGLLSLVEYPSNG